MMQTTHDGDNCCDNNYNKNNNDNNYEEELLYVPKEVMEYPLGFVIDSGASVTKVVYRSKKYYSGGKPLKFHADSGNGVLHLRNFNMNQVGDVINFLKENCDVIVEDDDMEWWMTGVTTQHFKKEIESTFKIRTKLFSEMMASNTFLKNFNQLNSECFDTDIESLVWAKDIAMKFYGFVLKSNDIDGKVKSLEPEASKTATFKGCSAELLTGDEETWAKKYLSFTGNVEFPSIVVNLGSAAPVGLITETDDFKVVDFMYGMGKILGGLAEELTGVSNFDKFIEMAERGNLNNVDLTTTDVMDDDHDDDDWYKIHPRDMTVFELGKISSNNYKGKGNYNKDDVAIGLLSVMLKLIAKISFCNAKLHNAKSIMFGGSLPKYKLVRHHLQRHLLAESIMNNLGGMDLVKIHFMRRPGFSFALGVWWQNVLKEKAGKK